MKTIAILEGYTIDAGEREYALFSAYGTVNCYKSTPPEEILPRLAGIEAVFVDGQTLTSSVMDACPDLKYIGIMATGTDRIDLAAAAERNIAVTNVPTYSGPSVAQHAFALLLQLTNHMCTWTEGAKDNFWETPHMELFGKTFGIVGYGAIGKHAATIAKGFGMNVLVCTGHPVADEEGLHFADLETLLTESDIVSLHRPLNEKTRHLINADTLSKMKEGAILINTARGGLIDEKALAEALISGHLKAAGLDVLTEEPPFPSNPLLHLPNCLVTPHLAWTSGEAKDRLRSEVFKNFEAWLCGRRRNRVEGK